DAWVQLDGDLFGLWKVAVNPFIDRTAPPPHAHHALRLRREQQEGHHAAGVGEDQIVRVTDAHAALDGCAPQVQIADTVLLADLNAGVCPVTAAATQSTQQPQSVLAIRSPWIVR